MQGYPPPGYGYPQQQPPPGYQPGYQGYPPPPQQPSGNKTLIIVLVVIGVILLLGGGSCVVCVGLASVANTPDPTMDHTANATEIEISMRAKQVPVDKVLCPKKPATDIFQCELTTTTGDTATVNVTKGATKLAWEVQNTAFLDGDKLTGIFASKLAGSNTNLRVPCFKGTLMKPVGSTFKCPVLDGSSSAGEVSVLVVNKEGTVNMNYDNPFAVPTPVATPTPVAPRTPRGPRIVDFTCPAGKAPGGAVRAGCLCGSEIIGTACGAPGNFTDVTASPRGCRFTCAN